MLKLRLIGLITIALSLPGCFAAMVGGGAAAATTGIHDQRSIGTQIDDITLTTEIDARLIAERDMPSRWISVQVINSTAYLTGQLPSKRHIERAAYIVKTVRGVRSVHSELQVGKPKLGGVMSDTWITTQVKSNLWKDEQVSGFSIKVETVNGKVYLQGIVNELTQRQRAKDLAKGVQGVTAIIDLMQVAKK